jgi:tRNA(Ile)-lysidine synthase
MHHPFEMKLAEKWPIADWAEVTALVAVSGGPDSMALLRAAYSLRSAGQGRLVVVHLNHHLRGAESNADEAFVRTQAEQWNLPCEVGSASSNPPLPDEDAARQARYQFFCQVARKWGARYVATAHTADDQAETILHRILRGTGLDGLAGIPASRQLIPGVSLVRPLLAFSRSEVLSYLRATEQRYREDSSNDELHFTRNKLRHELIPHLESQYNPRVKDALLRLGQLADEAQQVVARMARTLREQVVESIDAQGLRIRCGTLHSRDAYVVRHLLMDLWHECGWGLRDMTREHWQQLAELAIAQLEKPRSITFPGAVRAERTGETLRLMRIAV